MFGPVGEYTKVSPDSGVTSPICGACGVFRFQPMTHAFFAAKMGAIGSDCCHNIAAGRLLRKRCDLCWAFVSVDQG